MSFLFKGSILITERFLQDAYFQRSVVLLIERHGTRMGFVLNKKQDLIVKLFFKSLPNFGRNTDLSGAD